jgi:hypothetical protein
MVPLGQGERVAPHRRHQPAGRHRDGSIGRRGTNQTVPPGHYCRTSPSERCRTGRHRRGRSWLSVPIGGCRPTTAGASARRRSQERHQRGPAGHANRRRRYTSKDRAPGRIRSATPERGRSRSVAPERGRSRSAVSALDKGAALRSRRCHRRLADGHPVSGSKEPCPVSPRPGPGNQHETSAPGAGRTSGLYCHRHCDPGRYRPSHDHRRRHPIARSPGHLNSTLRVFHRSCLVGTRAGLAGRKAGLRALLRPGAPLRVSRPRSDRSGAGRTTCCRRIRLPEPSPPRCARWRAIDRHCHRATNRYGLPGSRPPHS